MDMSPIQVQAALEFFIEKLSAADRAELESRLTELATGEEPVRNPAPSMDSARRRRTLGLDAATRAAFPNMMRLGR